MDFHISWRFENFGHRPLLNQMNLSDIDFDNSIPIASIFTSPECPLEIEFKHFSLYSKYLYRYLLPTQIFIISNCSIETLSVSCLYVFNWVRIKHSIIKCWIGSVKGLTIKYVEKIIGLIIALVALALATIYFYLKFLFLYWLLNEFDVHALLLLTETTKSMNLPCSESIW